MIASSPDHVPRRPPSELKSHFRRRSYSSHVVLDDDGDESNQAPSSSAPRRNSSDHCNRNSISTNREGNVSRGSKCGSEAWNGQVRSMHVKGDCVEKREWSKDARAVIMSATSIVAASAQYSSSGSDAMIISPRPQLHRSVMNTSFDSDNYVVNEVDSPTTSWKGLGSSRRSIPNPSMDSSDTQSSHGMKRISTVRSFDSLTKAAASMDGNDDSMDSAVTRNHVITMHISNQPNNSRSNLSRSHLSKGNLSTLTDHHTTGPGSSNRGNEQYRQQPSQSPRNSGSRDSNLGFPRI